MIASDNFSPTHTLRHESRFSSFAEPTLDDLMTDPLVQALMRADRVDAGAMKILLDTAAGNLRNGRGSIKPRSSEPTFDSTTARWFPRPLHIEAVTASEPTVALVVKSFKTACGTSCQW